MQEPSDVEGIFSACGGPPSEAGSILDTTLNGVAAADDRRELESAYKDLSNQIHNRGARHYPVAAPSKQPVTLVEQESPQQGESALTKSKNFWMQMS